MASGSNNLTSYKAKQIIGSSVAASPAGALLFTGENYDGNTWIYHYGYGGTTNPWGIFHDTTVEKLIIKGNGTDSFWIKMNTGDTYIYGKVGIGYDPNTSGNSYKLYVDGDVYFDDTTYLNGSVGIGYNPNTNGNTYKLYVNGTSYFANTITGDIMSSWHILGGRPANTTNFNTYMETITNLHHDDPTRTDVEMSYNRFFLSHSDQTTYGPAALNCPVVDQHILSFGIDNGATYSRHIAFDIRSNAVYVRARTNNTWGNWEQLVRNTGTWAISITGNAATATKATQDGSGNTITDKYFQIYNTGYIGNSSSVTVNDLAAQGPAYGMINSATDNPHGSATWTHVLNMAWGKTNTSWIGQIAVGTSGGMWYRANGSSAISGKAWTRVLDSTGGTLSGNVIITGTGDKYFEVKCTDTSCRVELDNNAGNHGLWSSGYWNGSAYSGSSVWFLYRGTDSYAHCGTRLYNAVWNDFAEYRQGETIEGGRVVYDDGTGIMKITTKRLQPAARIISDTFGMAVGESDKAKTPIGVGGRVLAYPYKNRTKYNVGDAVCAAPNGTVDIMTREEIMMYPDRIIGIVSEIPAYDIWRNTLKNEEFGSAEVIVNDRIWVYVK